MKKLMLPIEAISHSDLTGKLIPLRFRMQDRSKKESVVRIGTVVRHQEEKQAGQRIMNILCQSMVSGEERQYELAYDINTCRWYLSKW